MNFTRRVGLTLSARGVTIAIGFVSTSA